MSDQVLTNTIKSKIIFFRTAVIHTSWATHSNFIKLREKFGSFDSVNGSRTADNIAVDIQLDLGVANRYLTNGSDFLLHLNDDGTIYTRRWTSYPAYPHNNIPS